MKSEIKVKISSQNPLAIKADLLAIPVFKSKNVVADFAAKIDRKLGGRLSELATLEKFQGDQGSSLSVYAKDCMAVRQVVLVGQGDYSKWTLDQLRKISAQMARSCAHHHGTKLAIAIPMPEASQYRYSAAPEELAQAVTEGVLLGTYRFTRYRKPKAGKTVLTDLEIIGADRRLERSLKLGTERGRIHAEATAEARSMVNEPPSTLTPDRLAQNAQALLKGTGVKVTIFRPKQIQAMGMNAFLAVARGNSNPPVMIQMEYKPQKATKEHIVLIGKGITFDSGGLSIKPAKSMETMKDDMAGAAAVIAAMRGIAQIKPHVRVTGLVLSTENMVDAHSVKPGDVVKAFSGKTIEILNTDAEGRLTLADALSYAQTLKPKPTEMIDVATLTGACLVALGDGISAALGNSRPMIQAVIEAGKRAGENFWELPLHEDYRDLIKSDIADLKNIGGSYGGTITAALFLSEFVDGTSWTHLDIAGPAWSEKDGGYFTKGGTGVAVRTLLNYVTTPH